MTDTTPPALPTPPTRRSAPATDVRVRRVAQFLVDTVLVLVVAVPLGRWWAGLGVTGGRTPDVAPTLERFTGAPVTVVVLFVLLHAAVFVLTPWARDGRTPGMVLMGLTVVRRDGRPVDVGALVVRWVPLLAGAAWGAVWFVELVAMVLSPDSTRLGDKVAGTQVVRARR